jgi:hypothetical protein
MPMSKFPFVIIYASILRARRIVFVPLRFDVDLNFKREILLNQQDLHVISQ